MYPQTHFLFAFLIGLIFSKLNFAGFDYRIALIAAVVAVFVDLDHYVAYFVKKKSGNLRDAFNKHASGVYIGRTMVHHTIGFTLITIAFIFIFYINQLWFWVLGLGYYSHMLLDFGHLNILKIKEKITLREAGFVERINKFEVLFDIFLVIGILLVVFV